jgi:hypothetical protein
MAKGLYKELATASPADSNLEAIRAYIICDGEGLELTEHQKELKEKIEFADEHIRSKNGFLRREAIANIIRHRFDVSRDTAFRYMRWAEDLYCSSNPLNKKFMILLRIEWCEQQARAAAFAGDLVAAAMFESSIAKYIAMYPDAARDPGKRKQIFIFNNTQLQAAVTEDAAIEVVSSYLSKKSENGE